MDNRLARALIGPLLLAFPLLAAAHPSAPYPVEPAATVAPVHDCEAGPSLAGWAVPSFLRAGEIYGVFVQGSVGCTSCDGGLQAESIGITIEAEGAVQLQLRPALYRLVPGGCWRPGEVLCEGPPVQVQLAAGERRAIELPIDCGCRQWGERQLAAVRVDSLEGSTPLLITDDSAGACVAWMGDELGWHDLQSSFGLPGRPLVRVGWACCEVVGTGGESWGHLKHHHRADGGSR